MDSNSSGLAARESGGAAAQQYARGAEATIRAPVDIYEDADGITLEADMPGVSKDRLLVRVEGNSLVIEGKVQFELPAHAEAIYADVRATTYRRNFVLGRELESSNIQAQLKDGVLKVRIPKRAELRPRKIEVQGA